MNKYSNKISIIRVFIASPTGLEIERQAAKDVVSEVNLSNAEHWGCQFNLIGWEDTIPGYQRPQSKINQDLDRCEYFIGVLWDRWGSRPTADPSLFTSGFEEEYLRAEEHIKSGQMKDLALYFRTIDIPSGMEPGENIKKVLDFRKKCIDEKRVFFKNFSTIDEFRNLVRSKLMEIGWREADLLRLKESDPQSEQLPAPSEDTKTEIAFQDAHLIDQEAIDFISELCKHSSGWDSTQPYEVARFRLIASSYVNSDSQRYYNSTHWLDMGTAMSKNMARVIARRQLEQY